jgi:hypothetical protein
MAERELGKEKLSLEDFSRVLGGDVRFVGNRMVALGHYEVCGRCGGTGQYSFRPDIGTMCMGCGGSGKILPKLTRELLGTVEKEVKEGKLQPYFEKQKKLGEAKKASKSWFKMWGDLPSQKYVEQIKAEKNLQGWIYSNEEQHWSNGYASELNDKFSKLEEIVRSGNAAEREQASLDMLKVMELLRKSDERMPKGLNKEVTDKADPNNEKLKLGGITAKEDLEKLFGKERKEVMPKFTKTEMPDVKSETFKNGEPSEVVEKEFGKEKLNPTKVEFSRPFGASKGGYAIMDYRNIVPITEEEARKKIIQAYDKVKNPVGYATYNAIQKETGLPYETILGILKQEHINDPHQIHFNVDRMGKNVFFKYDKKSTKEETLKNGEPSKVAELHKIVREPWRMSQDEYVAQELGKYVAESRKAGIIPNESYQKKILGKKHEELVRRMVSSGRLVPPEALKAYPDLARKEWISKLPVLKEPEKVSKPVEVKKQDNEQVKRNRETVASLQGMLDENKKSASLNKVERFLGKLDSTVVDGVDDVQSAIDEYRDLEREGMTPDEFTEEKQSLFDSVQEAIDELDVVEEEPEEEVKAREQKVEGVKKMEVSAAVPSKSVSYIKNQKILDEIAQKSYGELMELDDGAKRATAQTLGFSGRANIREIDDFLRSVKKDVSKGKVQTTIPKTEPPSVRLKEIADKTSVLTAELKSSKTGRPTKYVTEQRIKAQKELDSLYKEADKIQMEITKPISSEKVVAQPVIKKEKPAKLSLEATIKKVKASAKKEMKPVVQPIKRVMSEAVWNAMPVSDRVKLAQSKNLPGTVGSAEWKTIPPSIQGTLVGLTETTKKVTVPGTKIEPPKEVKIEAVVAKQPEIKVRVRKEKPVIAEVKPVVPKVPSSKPRLSNDVVADLKALRFTEADIAVIKTEEQARRILELQTKPTTKSLQSFMKKEAEVKPVEIKKPEPVSKVVIPKEQGGERVDDIILKRAEKKEKLQVGWKKIPEKKVLSPVPKIIQAEPVVEVKPQAIKPTTSDKPPYVEPTIKISKKRIKLPVSIPRTPAEILGIPKKIVETKEAPQTVGKETKPISYSERLDKAEMEHLKEVKKQQKAEAKRQRLLPVLWKPRPQQTTPMPMPPSSQRLLAPPISIREQIKGQVAEREAQEREREADAAERNAGLKKKVEQQRKLSQAESKQLALVGRKQKAAETAELKLLSQKERQEKSAEAREQKRKEKIARYLRGFGTYSDSLVTSAKGQQEVEAIQRERERRQAVKTQARIQKQGGIKYVTAKEKHAKYKRKERIKKWRTEETTPGFARRRKGKGKRIGTSPLGNVIQKVLYPVKPRKRGRW